MLNYRHRAASRRQIRIVDCSLQDALTELIDKQGQPRIRPLPEPDETPEDEKTPEFKFALRRAKTNDLEYLTRLQALDSIGRVEDSELAKLDQWLRARVREELDLPRRLDPYDINIAEHAKRNNINPSFELQSSGSTARTNTLQTLYFADELDARLGRLTADARLSEQETGLSTLFLAFGFLRWFDSKASNIPNFAPLLLLPVQLTKSVENRRVVYKIQATADFPEINLSLREFLLRDSPDVPRTIPDFDSDEDNIARYFEKINEAIVGLPSWRVERYLTLGHFLFGRLAMFADLEPENWKTHPLDTELLATLMRGSEEGALDFDKLMFAQDYDVDSHHVEDCAPILISDADASQHSAIIDIMQGKNLAIEGPPGTGKSQTITNIIANALYTGKSVLFLADKQAALEVVQNRLGTAGLASFCLELHSHKAQSKMLVERLRERCEQQEQSVVVRWQNDLTKVRSARTHVTEYLNSLHSPAEETAESAFNLFWSAIAQRRNLAREFETARNVDLSATLKLDDLGVLQQARDALEIYASTADNFQHRFGPIIKSPWSQEALQIKPEVDLLAVADSITTFAAATENLRLAIEAVSRDVGLDFPAAAADIESWLGGIQALPEIPRDSLFSAISSFSPIEIERFGQLACRKLRLQEKLIPALLKFATADLSELAAEAKSLNLSSQTPLQIVATVEHARRLKRDIDQGLQSLNPLVKSAPLPETPSVRTALAIAATARFANELPEDICEFLTTGVSSAALLEGCKQLNALKETDADLRTKFAYPKDSAWPTATGLKLLLDVLQSSFAKRVKYALTGKRAKAKRVANALGRKIGQKRLEDNVAELLRYRLAESSFLSNSELKEASGPFWRGLDTPLHRLALTVEFRMRYDCELVPLSKINAILRTQFLTNKKVIEALRSYAEVSEKLILACEQWPTELREVALDEAQATIEAQFCRLEAFVAKLRSISLDTSQMPFEVIASHAEKQTELEQLIERLTNDPLIRSVPAGILSNEKDCEALFVAADVLRSIAKLGLAESLAQYVSQNGSNGRIKLADAAVRIRPALHSFLSGASRVSQYMPVSVDLKFRPLSELSRRFSALAPFSPSLPSWVEASRQRLRTADAGLLPLIEAFEAHDLSLAKIVSTFDALVAHRRAMTIRGKLPYLQVTTGIELERRREQFRQHDAELRKKQLSALKAELLSRKPLPGSDIGPKKNWTEMYCLKHEFSRQRHNSIRDLMRRAGPSIQALQPCFMMSPLSLAKFIPSDALKFDLLIIDEASQMRPEDAIGGLLRAEQVVVVGDPKQLPPSDFFSRIAEDPSPDEDDLDDPKAESILDWCLRTYHTPRRLKWHYRSKCESLIAFSNRQFYGDNLITFPSARPQAFSIDLVRLKGNYRKGRNPAEASRVVEAAIDFMVQHSQHSSEEIPTLGIVAINSEQREFILEEFNRASDTPEVDRYLKACETATQTRGSEPFFVKNLENVQGDERDVIMISMTYGAEPGRENVAQRFGPINKSQGHRRLNVLFTRARKRIILFSSMGAKDIVVEPNSSRGINVLREYLRYVEARSLEPGRVSHRDFDSDFERDVCGRLRDANFEVDPQVGVGCYRVDLGVRHPKNPAIYMAGIECDGAAYHSAKSSRDRDKIREAALRSLGWTILRIWSTDWFSDPQGQTAQLVNKLRNIAATTYTDGDGSAYLRMPSNFEGLDSEKCDRDSHPELHDQSDFNAILSKQNGKNGSNGSSISRDEARVLLREFRDQVIFTEFPGSEPERSILRDKMIEKLIEAHVDEPDDFSSKIPLWLRERTDPRQTKYLGEVCAIIERVQT